MDKILIVEDATSLRELLKGVLEMEGFQAHTVETAESAWEWLKSNQASLVLADFKLPGKNGMQLLQRVRKVFPSLPYIIMTAYGTIEMAVDAMKLGADDFITKPFSPEDLISLVKDVLSPKSRSLKRYTKEEEQKFLTADPIVKNILKEAKKAAPYSSPILILGESGVGKEVLARFIHRNSLCAHKPFIAVNCGALPETLLESELFGHEAGAFTGATKAREGLFEVASEGTLFLDEVAELSSYLQAKLLRVLQDGEMRRIGSNKTVRVNPRIIAATNKDLKTALKNNSFRKDFYYRISVIEFSIPPLRERPKDIELLTEYALADLSRKYNKS
ncbi:MAG: sigma-54-dependent Fis family transcriptional regulator, partial [Candidatus Dadabacteria bacterium]